MGILWEERKARQEQMDTAQTRQSPLCGWQMIQMTTIGCRDNGNSKTKGKLHCKWESCIFKCFLVQILKSSYLPASFSLVKKQMERLMRSAFSMKALWISGRHGRKFQEAAELAISLPYLQCTGTSKQPTSEGKGQGCSSYRDPLARKDRLSPIPCVLFCISKIQYRAQEIFIFK